MYQALEQAFNEVGNLEDRPLTEKDATVLCHAFLEAVQELTQAASQSKDQQDSIAIKKLLEGMMAGDRIIKHIFNNQLDSKKNSI